MAGLRNQRYYTLWQNADDQQLILIDDVKNLRHLVTELPSSAVDTTNDYLAIHDKSSGYAKQFTLADLLALVISGGAGVLQYSNNNCMITASNTGVTITKDDVNGIVTVDVPENVYLYGVNLILENRDVDASNNIIVRVVYNNNTTINQDLNTVDVPQVAFVDISDAVQNNIGVVDALHPAAYATTAAKDIYLITSETSGGDGILQIKVESILEDNFIIKLTF